jgi:hypothetical protein
VHVLGIERFTVLVRLVGEERASADPAAIAVRKADDR